MPDYRPSQGALALYKVRPAIVLQVGEKIEIQLEGDKLKRVRAKDIQILHPGPLTSLNQLEKPASNLEDAWELLADEQTNLTELAELVFGEFTPSSAWFAWELLTEGLYFEGTSDQITARSQSAIDADIAEQSAKQAAEQEWAAFLRRLQQKKLDDSDFDRLVEVERVGLGQAPHSKILVELGYQETPESAHRMLTQVGFWPQTYNPHPLRQGVAVADPELEPPLLEQGKRLDLTHLPAYAIDDEGSNDPDDAISLEGDRIWVHVADVSAVVKPDSPVDIEARERGANLYLPDKIVHMLPPAITDQLALGLQERSPALSIGFGVDETGAPVDIRIETTWVAVTRHTYGEVDGLLNQAPFGQLKAMTDKFQASRLAAEAASIDLPEVSVRVREEQVVIKPLDRLGSREMVTEAMLMAGRAVAIYALEHDIALPFATQPPPEKKENPQSMAAMYAYRRQMRPSRQKTDPEPHSGLGLDAYVRATSPLRRYLDLVTHQQLRCHIEGKPGLDKKAIAERIAACDMPVAAIRRAERFSNQHWKLIHLATLEDQSFEAVPVEIEERKSVLIIPSMAMEVRMRTNPVMVLDQPIRISVASIELEELEARFRLN